MSCAVKLFLLVSVTSVVRAASAAASDTMPWSCEEASASGIKNSTCKIRAPTSAAQYGDSWTAGAAPHRDDLDEYIINITSPVCRYAGQAVHEEYVFDERPYEGRLEGLVMVRTGGETRIDVRWITGHNDAYAYHIKLSDVTTLYECLNTSPCRVVTSAATAGVLRSDQYVPFYIRIEEDTLYVGTLCDARVQLTADVTINREDIVIVRFKPFTTFGAKFIWFELDRITDDVSDCAEQESSPVAEIQEDNVFRDKAERPPPPAPTEGDNAAQERWSLRVAAGVLSVACAALLALTAVLSVYWCKSRKRNTGDAGAGAAAGARAVTGAEAAAGARAAAGAVETLYESVDYETMMLQGMCVHDRPYTDCSPPEIPPRNPTPESEEDKGGPSALYDIAYEWHMKGVGTTEAAERCLHPRLRAGLRDQSSSQTKIKLYD